MYNRNKLSLRKWVKKTRGVRGWKREMECDEKKRKERQKKSVKKRESYSLSLFLSKLIPKPSIAWQGKTNTHTQIK